ncbi:dehydrogenase [Hydrogenophaga crassostreae]|uniref:Dehydrogenase n=1 Tax=Hydrogenophaga crassostreae TaxID=1763535 RepID=A0A167GR62_9BURK|nr:LacI family DNA-binding transcriptional regulator [Hydrogenophaga crassostreae]AOW11697.1 dehydrogenase [Hydrogenophaga crassostreae]OAD39790.1 dehydrogenase [Hydrogenophaga crassostreae]
MKKSAPATEQRELRVTIDDVARVAGVSKATVSRFLNHRTTRLSPEIALRVEKAVADLAYMPSPMAQALKRGRSRLIGLVVADITNPFSVAVLRGAEDAAQKAGYLVMLFNLGNAGEREREGIEALASYQVEGFILNTLGADSSVARELSRHGKPAVLVDRRLMGMQADFVSLDNTDAVRQAVTHLVGNGWSEFLYVTEPVAGVSPRVERAAAFRTAAAEHARDMGGSLVFEAAEGDDAALDQALLDLKRRAGKKPKAVLASNARTTLRVAESVARLGWVLGRDVGFVGIDETPWASLVGPGLTTIEQPTDDIGRLAVGCLLERIQGQDLPPRQVLLTGRLVARASSQPPAR